MVKMYKTSQVAQILNVHANTVKRIPADELPFYAIGSRGDRRYLINDLSKYLSNNKNNPRKGSTNSLNLYGSAYNSGKEAGKTIQFKRGMGAGGSLGNKNLLKG